MGAALQFSEKHPLAVIGLVNRSAHANAHMEGFLDVFCSFDRSFIIRASLLIIRCKSALWMNDKCRQLKFRITKCIIELKVIVQPLPYSLRQT